MRIADASSGRARVTVERYADLLAVRAIPEYRFIDRSTVEFDATHLHVLGIDTEQMSHVPDELAPHLFDYQEWVTRLALERERFAVFADTGLGKTAMLLEYGRVVTAMTGGRVLIVAPLNVCHQTIAEAEHFYAGDLDVADLADRAALADWLGAGAGLGITNYEKLDGTDQALPVAGLILDESSILKQSMGARRSSLVAAGRGLRYKLCCSATPAPNDRVEYAEHAFFLDVVRSTREFLAAYFVNRDGNWQLKRHGEQAFYRHLASWSVFMRDPKSYGFSDHLADMPPLEVTFPRVPLTTEQVEISREYQSGAQMSLLGTEAGGVARRTKLMQIAHGFVLEAA